MIKNTVTGIVVAAILCGCATEDPSDGDLKTAESAIVGQDTYLYFRCNATGWGVDETSRLRATVDPYVFSLFYDVKQDYMKTNGDSCSFTETNQKNGWGTLQTNYGTVHGTVAVPSGDYLATNGPGFTVRYPELGRYKVTVNWMQGTFLVGPASNAEVANNWQPCGTNAVTTIAQSPQALDNVFVGCSNGDVYLTSQGRSIYPSWLKVDTWQTSAGTFGLPDSPVNAIAVSPADIKTAYISVAGSKQGHKLWKTGTGGANWIELSSVPLAEIWSVSVNPLDTSKVYVFGPGGVAMSPDFGSTWTTTVSAGPLNVPFASGSTLSTVSVAAGNRDIVWVGATNGDIFYTTNATTGKTWFKATHGMPTRAVTHLAIDTTRGTTTVYATFDGLYNDSLWVTSNNGFGWANLHQSPLPTTPQALPGIYAFYGVSPNPIANSVLYIDGTYGAGLSTSSGASFTWTTTN